MCNTNPCTQLATSSCAPLPLEAVHAKCPEQQVRSHAAAASLRCQKHEQWTQERPQLQEEPRQPSWRHPAGDRGPTHIAAPIGNVIEPTSPILPGSPASLHG